VKVATAATVPDAAVGPGDVVVLATKSQDTPAALASLAESADPDLLVVCAQNGVDNERQALRSFSRVYGLCVMMPATHLAPGEVRLDSDGYPGILDLGVYPSGTDEAAQRIAADLRAAGFGSIAHPAIMTRKYRKLLLNLVNVLDAAVMPSPRIGEVHGAAQAEALAIFAAAGIAVGSSEEDTERRRGMQRRRVAPGEQGGSSTWQSLVRGRSGIESDYLNGEVVLTARLHGLRAPVNEVLWRLGHRVVRDGIAPRSLDIEPIAAEVDAARHGA
jgi:2-dehydropantoate 2-reductase